MWSLYCYSTFQQRLQMELISLSWYNLSIVSWFYLDLLLTRKVLSKEFQMYKVKIIFSKTLRTPTRVNCPLRNICFEDDERHVQIVVTQILPSFSIRMWPTEIDLDGCHMQRRICLPLPTWDHTRVFCRVFIAESFVFHVVFF